jgi:hypothetical protein
MLDMSSPMSTESLAKERVLVLVDGSNSYHQIRRRGLALELDGFLPWARAFGTPEIHWFQGAHDCSASFLYEVRCRRAITLHAIRPHSPAHGPVKADADTTLVVVGAERMLESVFGTLVLFGGDSDYLPLLDLARRKGLRIVVVCDDDALHHQLAAKVDASDLLRLSDQLDLLRGSPRGWAA